MKKVFLTVIAFLTITSAFAQQSFGEFFVNKFTQEYDSLKTLCASLNMAYVMNHFWSSDTLKNPDVSKRMTQLGANVIPSVFIKGYKLSDNDLLSLDKWKEIDSISTRFCITPSVKSKIERFAYMNPPLNVFTTYVNLSGIYTGEMHIVAMVTENFPGTKYMHVMRQIMYDTLYNGTEIKYSIAFKSNWTLDNSELTIIIEDSNRKVIGISQIPIRSTFTGIENNIAENSLNLYPNPVTSVLNISSGHPIENIKIFDATGKLLVYKTFKDELTKEYKMNMNISSGLYFIIVNNNEARKIIKK